MLCVSVSVHFASMFVWALWVQTQCSIYFFVCVCWNDWSLRPKKNIKWKKCKGIGSEQQENDDAMILQRQKQNDLLKIHQRDLNISINRWRSEPKWKKNMQVKEIVFDNRKGL